MLQEEQRVKGNLSKMPEMGDLSKTRPVKVDGPCCTKIKLK